MEERTTDMLERLIKRGISHVIVSPTTTSSYNTRQRTSILKKRSRGRNVKAERLYGKSNSCTKLSPRIIPATCWNSHRFYMHRRV